MAEADPRWVRSRQMLLDAIFTYLDSGTAPSITEITTAAGVSRPTFYQHFGDLPTAYANAAVERISSQFTLIEVPATAAALEEKFLLDTLTHLLSHQLEHRAFYLKVASTGDAPLSKGLVSFLTERLITASPFASQFNRESAASIDRATALAAGVVWLIHRWLEETSPEPADVMAHRILEVLRSFLGTSAASE